jgi:hypothetical protein
MDVSRRGFLGSLLGTYIATQAPWIARAPNFFEPSDTTSLYRLLLILADGTEIKGPAIKDVANDVLTYTYSFIAEPIEVKRPFAAIGTVLVGPTGEPLCRGNWPSLQAVFPGDTLRATHHVPHTLIAEGFLHGPRPQGRRPLSGFADGDSIIVVREPIKRRKIIMPKS